MSKTEGMLLSYRADRFGARLMSLVNAKRVSDAYGIPFLVYWVQATDIGAIFNDATELFASEFVDRHFMTDDEWRKRRGKSTRIGDFSNKTSKQFLNHIARGKDVLIDMAFGIFSFPDEDPDEVRKDFVQAFHDIAKSPQLAGIFTDLESKLKGATAYHIRRGDLVDVLRAKNRSWPKKFIPTQFYKYHMRKNLEAETAVILFSDEKATLQIYKDEFPTARSLRDLIGDISLTDAGYDFLELYAMSHCSKIIAPAQSAFSAAAAELGNIPIVPLMDDFSAPDHAKLFEEFIAQLENTPEGDFNKGEIGQCLVHATDYLLKNKQSARAGRLMESWVLRGLNISHIYSSASALQSQLGDFASILRMAKAADKGYVLFSKDKVILEQCRAYAHLQQDQHEDALRHAQNAFWADSMHPHNEAIVSTLYQSGIFNDTNAFPIEADLLKQSQRGAPYRILMSTYPEMIKTLPESNGTTLPNLRPLVWNWAFFLGNHPKPKKPEAEQLLGKIEKLRGKSGDAPWMRGYEGLLEIQFGDLDEAVKLLNAAFDQSATALNAYRLSYANWQRRNIPEMLTWATKATKLSDAPIYKVWLGNTLTRLKRLDEAEALLTQAVPPLDGFASVLEIEGNLWQRMGNTKKLVETYNKIAKLAPLSGYMRQKQAQAFVDDNQSEAAFKAMRIVCETEYATPKGYAMYIGFLITAKRVDEAKSILSMVRQKFPRSNAFDNIALS
jgi:tetratricopeptide (TPR) repeat protein